MFKNDHLCLFFPRFIEFYLNHSLPKGFSPFEQPFQKNRFFHILYLIYEKRELRLAFFHFSVDDPDSVVLFQKLERDALQSID